MRRKPIHVFLLHAGFVLALIAALPDPQDLYARVLHSAGNSLLHSMGEGRSVLFEWSDPAERKDASDTRMTGLEAGYADYRWRVIFSGFRRGFWPSATLLALTLAVPLSRRRLAVAIPVGLVLFNAFFLAEIAVLAWVLYAATGSIVEVSATTWRRAVPVALAVFNSPITNFAAVFAIWTALARPDRGIDLGGANALVRRLLGPAGARPPAPDAAAESRRDGAPGDGGAGSA